MELWAPRHKIINVKIKADSAATEVIALHFMELEHNMPQFLQEAAT